MKYQLEGKECTREEAAAYAARFGYAFEELEASIIDFMYKFGKDDRCDWFLLSFIKEAGAAK